MSSEYFGSASEYRANNQGCRVNEKTEEEKICNLDSFIHLQFQGF